MKQGGVKSSIKTIAVGGIVGGILTGSVVLARRFIKKTKKQNKVSAPTSSGEEKMSETHQVLEDRERMWSQN